MNEEAFAIFKKFKTNVQAVNVLIKLSGLLSELKKMLFGVRVASLSNFCRGKPQPSFDQVKPALPALAGLIHSNDEEVLTDAWWALSYLSDGTNDKIQGVIEVGVRSQLVELLQHPAPSVLIPALRTVGNIVTGDDMQTQEFFLLPLVLLLIDYAQTIAIDYSPCAQMLV